MDPAALADALKLAIQNGTLVPGQRLVEIDLMHRYGVSRACVRAALRTIETERLVEIVKNRGAVVRRVTREEVIQTIDVLDELSVLTIRRVTANIHGARTRLTESASRKDVGMSAPPRRVSAFASGASWCRRHDP